MAVTGLDYSAGTIPPAAILAAGHTFVIRYTDDPVRCTTKHIRPAEYAALHAAGIVVFLVFEGGTDDITGGRPAGAANAARALTGAAAVGYPPGLPIFLAVDEHVPTAALPTAVAYLTGGGATLAAAGYRLGVYGFAEVITAAQAAGIGDVWWQCGHDPGPAAGVHLWQRNDLSPAPTVAGIACDVNVAYLPLPTAAAKEATVAMFDWPAGAGAHKLVCPVGSKSEVTAAAWLSLACDGALGRYDIWFQGDKGGLTEQHGALTKDQRGWWALPDGCTQITLHYAGAAGAVGAAIEVKPK